VSPAVGTALPVAGAIAAPGNGTQSITFADVNGNPLAQGTTISASVSGAGLSLGTPSSFTVPCTTEPTAYPFTIIKGLTATTGTMTITVTSPSGLQSLLSYPVQ
jgi:hypothetical protein